MAQTAKAAKASVDQQDSEQADAAAVESYKHRMRMQYGEYGQWVAAVDIPAPDGGSVLAFGEGHPVPVAHVERYGYESLGYVRRPDNFAFPELAGGGTFVATDEQPAADAGESGDA